MALYQLILAYEGTDFSGFQRQGNTRTVQVVLEETLKEIGWQEESLLFAGRTDAGVHASGQVVAFWLDWHHSSTVLQNAINARLPSDVAVSKIIKLETEFHPRYDASSRVYRYSIYHEVARHPLKDRFSWRVWPELDGERLDQVADLFLGKHDFAAFGRAMKPGASTIREIYSSHWTHTGESGWQYEIEANAFLYHMVRRLVYIQVRYAREKLTLTEIKRGLESQLKLNQGLAPAHGLVLYKVNYDGFWRGNVEEDLANEKFA